MEKKQKIFEYREKLNKTLASDDLVNKKSIKNLVRNQLIHSSPSDTHGYTENILANRTTEVSNFLDMLRSASKNDSGLSKTDGMPQCDWKLKQDNEDFRVMYREGPEGTPFHTLLVEGYVDGPLDVCLCISWEAALFKKWWPQYNVPPFKIIASNCLQEVRIGEQIVQNRLKVAWPLSAREVILHYFELEYFEDDLIIVLLKSISDTDGVDKSTHGYTRDGIPDAKDFVRVDVVGGFVIQKVAPNISYFRTIATMDIKLDFVPPSLINFISRQLIGSGFKLYKKTVASIAKGDEDFGKALKAPLYVRVREGSSPINKLKKVLKPEDPESDKSSSLCFEGLAAQIPQVDTMFMEQINFSDSHPTTSSQADRMVPSLTYNGEIEEVEVEQEPQSEAKNKKSRSKIEVEVGQETHLKGDEVRDHSTTNLTADQCSNEKTISPEVEHALRILDNAISMVRKGLSIQNWPGFRSNSQELLHLERVATEVGSTSSEDRSDDGVSLKAPKVDDMEALSEDESSSGFFDIRPDKQDSPLREVKNNQVTPTPSKPNSTLLDTTHDSARHSSHSGKMLEAPVLDNMSSDFKEVTVKVNGSNESSDKGGELRKNKQRRCCLYFFPANK